MKLLVCAFLVLAVVVSSEELLGADDVDRKASETLEHKLAIPKTLSAIKSLRKSDQKELKEMKIKAHELKQAREEKNTNKSDKKNLKKELEVLRSRISAKKNELHVLKAEQIKLKKGKKHNGKKKDKEGKKNMFLTGGEEQKINDLDTTLKVETTTATAALPEESKKAQRRAEKKAAKKNKNKNSLMMADAPVLKPTASALPTRQHKEKLPCETDKDCHDGAKCKANKKGHKHCKQKGRPAGKKCHSSEQCMEGLQCFITKTAEQLEHKIHKRRGKGHCADPHTTDTTKGTFAPPKA